MLATNVDVPVFFCILIPSRNMVNRKGQLPPPSFQSQAHTHERTQQQNLRPKAHRVTESQRPGTYSDRTSIIIFICLTSSSPSSICLVPSSSSSLGLICLALWSSSSLSLDLLGAVVTSSLSLNLLSVAVLLLALA